MLQIAICDDIAAHSEQLIRLLQCEVNVQHEVKTYDSPAALLGALKNDQYFDLFFIDIELGEENGVALAARINELLPFAQIIFVTSNIMHAVQIDEANHVYFLVKPIDPDKLHMAFMRATAMLRAQMDKRLAIPLRGGGDAIVSSGRIVYCERVKRVTYMVCTDQTIETPMNLAALEASLPPILFARPHNSFLVNLMHVTRTDWLTVYLDNGQTISISNQRRAAFRDALATYVAK